VIIGMGIIISKMFYSMIPIYILIKMCYDFEIPERIKQKSRIVSGKVEEEKEVLDPIKVSN